MRFWIKFGFVFAMTLAILVPLGLIDGVVDDRQRNRAEAVAQISSTFAGAQVFGGPVLVVPYTDSVEVEVADTGGGTRKVRRDRQSTWTYFPDSLDVAGPLEPSTRRLGLHSVRVYEWAGRADARFTLDVPAASDPLANRRIGQPWLSYGIADVRGLRGTPRLTVNGAPTAVLQGQGSRDGAGVHARLPAPQAGSRTKLSARLDLVLGGTESLSLVPLGWQNRFALDSSWPHPRLAGRFPARQPRIDGDGFAAQWEIPALAADAQRQYRSGRALEAIDSVDVSLVDPVNAYTQADRAIKYGILFVLLTFVGFFMLELLLQLRIHPIQYGLVGLALSIFFLLLVSLSEHIAFGLAYALASAACVGVIGFYLCHVLGSAWRGVGFALILGTLYAALYGLLVSEDNALLLGSLLLFAILAGLMVATRKVDWYRASASTPSIGPLA
ncbi:cell envelope integrity protein CreD [Aerolutibacter ruishenii]|uniref:Inner membrane protein n=1 Tax=Aerolutibacter ruishenii TaxID=686800 RepID=A0A562LIC0_9GAMM|nr:cell envelope integrity protein CreD [Lysobacter ruishenii]TWI07358.1 inner membrane protein [Lysobacter ruishenii]